jgi:hypothetical protein
MKIDGIKLQYFIDYLEKRVHLMDMNPVGQNLANAMCPDFQKKFVEQEHLLSDVADFEWLLYVGNLIISYQNYDIKVVNAKLPYVHKPFLKTLEDRAE